MENGVVTVLYFFTLFYGKQEGNPSSHFMTFGTPSSSFLQTYSFILYPQHSKLHKHPARF